MAARNVTFAVVLALVYGLFGMAWILASDTVLATLVSDPVTLTMVQTWKGWAFVVLSAALIYGLGRRLLRALAESEERYRILFSGSPEPLALYDPVTLTLVEINAATGRLLGYDPAELCGTTYTDLMGSATREAFENDLPGIRSGKAVTGVLRLHRKDGRPVDVTAHGQTVMIEGRPLRLLQFADVTARLRSEYELLRTLEQVAATNERMCDLGRALSHDVQEPLRQVSGFVQLLARRYEGKLDAEAQQFIAYAVEGIHRLKAVIGDIERFAQSASVVPVPVRVERVVGEVLDVLRQSIESAGVAVETGPLPEVMGDAGKLAVIFHALVDNAVKFRAPGRPARVRIEGEAQAHGWRFRVSDNGLGIAPEFHESVFSLFSRLHTRDRIPGNGTGLALARKLVEAQGGHIWIESGEDDGIAVCFTLPQPLALAGEAVGAGGAAAGRH